MAEVVVTSAFLIALGLISPKKLTVKYDDVSKDCFIKTDTTSY